MVLGHLSSTAETANSESPSSLLCSVGSKTTLRTEVESAGVGVGRASGREVSAERREHENGRGTTAVVSRHTLCSVEVHDLSLRSHNLLAIF
jgi:hypothetical protein